MSERSVSARGLVAETARILLVNGQTTEGTGAAVERLALALGAPARFSCRWGEFALIEGDDLTSHPADQVGVDIGRVVATEAVVDDICLARLDPAAAHSALAAIGVQRPVSLLRFAPMAAAGAAALSVIFGAATAPTLALIAASAGLGAVLRRAFSHLTSNPFGQPFIAALFAGIVGGAAQARGWPVEHRLVAVCPCMVLVPGPHFLNGAIDLARARIPLGAARLAFAGLVVLAICVGLLAGLALTGSGLPSADAGPGIPLGMDVLAAGVAVAAYGSFFNMAWSMLPVPIAAGMLAHALRWELLHVGVSLAGATFAACSLVGVVVAPVCRRFGLPFGAFAFAATVSQIPGVLMFQAASDSLALVNDPEESASALVGLVSNVPSVAMILLAMGAGVILPKMVLDRWLGPAQERARLRDRMADPARRARPALLIGQAALWVALAGLAVIAAGFLAGLAVGFHNSFFGDAPKWQIGVFGAFLISSLPLQFVLLLGAWRQARAARDGDAVLALGAGRLRRPALLLGLVLFELVFVAGWAALIVRVIGTPRTVITATVLNRLAAGGIAPIVVTALLFVVVAPVCEELFFRGWLWTGLRRRWPAVPVALLTALPWLALHLMDGGWRRVLFLLPAATMLSVARHVCGSVRASIVMHMCNNAAAAALVVATLSGR